MDIDGEYVVFPKSDDSYATCEDDLEWCNLHPLTVDVTADYGWLSPDGDLYSCGYADHEALKFALEEHFRIKNLEDSFLKISHNLDSMNCYTAIFIMENKLTQKQFDTLYDWYIIQQLPLPARMREFEIK